MADLTPRSKAFFPSNEHLNCRRREGPAGALRTIPKATPTPPQTQLALDHHHQPPLVRDQHPATARFVKFTLDDHALADKRKTLDQRIENHQLHVKMFHEQEQLAKQQQPDVIHMGFAPAEEFMPSLSPKRQHLPPMSDSTLKRLHVGPDENQNDKHSRSFLGNAMASSPGVLQHLTTVDNSSEEVAKSHHKRHGGVAIPEPKPVGVKQSHGFYVAPAESKPVGVKHHHGVAVAAGATPEVPKHVGVKHLGGAGEELTNSMKPAKMEVLPQHRGLVGRKDPHPPTVQDHLHYTQDGWQPMAALTPHHHMLHNANKPAVRGPHMLDPSPFRYQHNGVLPVSSSGQQTHTRRIY